MDVPKYEVKESFKQAMIVLYKRARWSPLLLKGCGVGAAQATLVITANPAATLCGMRA